MNSETAILEKKPLDDAKKKFKRRSLYLSMKKQLIDDSSSEDERTDDANLPSRNVASSVRASQLLSKGTLLLLVAAKRQNESYNFNEADLAIAN